MSKQIIKPFELLLEYERRSVAHALGGSIDDESFEDWSGIGFKVGDDHLVSVVDDINEVVILPELIRIPGIETWVLGLVNIRSNLIPAIDLKQYLFNEPSRITKHSRMLIIDQPGGQAGLVVDEVFGQRHFQQKQWKSLESIEGGNGQLTTYCEKFFNNEDINWNVFLVDRLIHDVNFQNASAK